MQRCPWSETNELFLPYHDHEWGIPNHDDRHLFEMLNLEGAQAGLSWLTILKKRDHYREVFDDFDAIKVAAYDETKQAELLQDTGIIRNRLKVNAFIENAKSYLVVQKEFGSFDQYLWQHVDHQQLTRHDSEQAQAIALMLSRDLSRRGFKFVGPTIVFSYMQATGMINDHTGACFREREIAAGRF